MGDFGLTNLIGNTWIEIKCPGCGFSNPAREIEVVIESKMLCSGCYSTINLRQESASGTRANQQLRMMEEMILKSLKNIKLELKL